MRVQRMALVLLALGLSASCVQAETGQAIIKGTAEGSAVAGTAALTDTPQGLRVNVHVSNVSPGDHGLHIHENGSCADLGKGAGGHYNPDGVQHGYLPKDGATMAHAGDMGNIIVGADGTGTLEVVLPGVALTSGAHTVNGRAIILHEKTDDFGQPTGNAGGRIGCGPILLNKD